MVALDLLPYSFVEKRGSKALMKAAAPCYSLPYRTKLSRVLVPRLYDETKANVRQKLRKALEQGTSTLAFTRDIWTSRINESFLSPTCHFLTVKFEMKNFTFNTRHMLESHTAVNIAASLEQLCTDWEMPIDCVKYIGTDNGRNIRAAARKLSWLQRACFAHTLQLAISDAMSCTPANKRLCKKAKAIVGNYKRSLSGQERLNDLQRQLKEDVLHVVQDVDTRWNNQ
ncbi:zinc finger BED domain-containing protein 4-like [Dermacentor andersoni]|uniref:zinc finger BED domain-containing protein 4-like n=1 Tax=Dermacentor andersoni TaxID=34620 RepID=UPI003B3A533E